MTVHVAIKKMASKQNNNNNPALWSSLRNCRIGEINFKSGAINAWIKTDLVWVPDLPRKPGTNFEGNSCTDVKEYFIALAAF